MKSDFFEFIRKNNLSCHVNYHNLVLDQQKADLLAKSHFFILPTNYSTEAQPLSIIEAIANGCVIITTNFRAIPDMVIDNFNGKFVEYGNPLSITQNISYFVNNPSVYESSSSNSVLHYQKYFTIDNFNNKVVELFEQIRN
jgi:glycosyltransferase involved in cell wall biosynthesis